MNTLKLLMIAAGLSLCLGAFLASPNASAEEKKAPEEGQTAPPAGGESESVPAAAAPAEPSRIEGKLVKVDAKAMMITVLVAPERGSSNRAYRKFKMKMDDRSLVLIDQQPGTMAGLEEGSEVQVMYFDKGKEQVVDTVVVTAKPE